MFEWIYLKNKYLAKQTKKNCRKKLYLQISKKEKKNQKQIPFTYAWIQWLKTNRNENILKMFSFAITFQSTPKRKASSLQNISFFISLKCSDFVYIVKISFWWMITIEKANKMGRFRKQRLKRLNRILRILYCDRRRSCSKRNKTF